MGKNIGLTRVLRIGLVWLVCAVLLSGCVATERGQTLSSAAESINAVDGLSATTRTGGAYSGWSFHRWSSAQVTIETGFRVMEWGEFVTWLARSAWSMNEDKPNQGISVSITFADHDEFVRWQLEQRTLELPRGYEVSVRDRDVDPKITADVSTRFAEEAGLGPWPGDVPTLSDNVIVKVADE